MADIVALSSIALAISQIPAYTVRLQIQASSLRDVPVYFKLSLVLISRTHGGMARLS